MDNTMKTLMKCWASIIFVMGCLSLPVEAETVYVAGVAFTFDESELSNRQQRAILKVLRDHRKDATLVSVFEFAASNNNEIVIHHGPHFHSYTGATKRWHHISFYPLDGALSEDLGDGKQARPGTKIHISLNPVAIESMRQFRETFIHELLHIVLVAPRPQDEEALVYIKTKAALKNLW